MKIVFLDGFTTQKGDIDDACLHRLGNYQMFDRSSPEEAIERASDADILITNKFVIDHKTLANLPGLKYIVVAATGFNNIDVAAVREKNIPVSNVRSYSTSSVVQQSFASLLEVLNRPSYYFKEVRNNRWSSCPDFCFIDHSIRELSDLTLGIVGMGEIGTRMAATGMAFGMRVVTHTRTPKSIPGVEPLATLPELLSTADVVSLHLPLNAGSKEMINQQTLSIMKQDAILINTGRGALIHEKELAAHLIAHPSFTAILDVLSVEPPVGGNDLCSLPNCYVTPHIAWASAKARQNLLNGIAKNIEAFQQGQWINAIYERE